MRLAVVGSFSTGKTTLATAVARKMDLSLLPEAAREVAALGFALDKSATAEAETLIFLKTFEAELRHASFVADRSLFDVIAYGDWVLDHSPDRVENHLWTEARRIATHDLRGRYDLVVYLPIEFPIALDGLRPDDEGFRREVDERLRNLLATHDVPYEQVRGSPEQRLEVVTALVDKFR